MASYYRDRTDAGRRLASRLSHLRREHPVVLGLPRGGVPVAYEVALALDAPLDVLVVRKLGLPAHPELAMGAIGEGGVRVLNPDVLDDARVGRQDLRFVEDRERIELDRRARRFRGGRTMLPLQDRTVVIVDDGFATGASARAAVEVARRHGAARVILAVPVAPLETVRELRRDADEVVVDSIPTHFRSLGEWYGDFSQTTDDEVTDLLARGSASIGSVEPAIARPRARSMTDREVTVDASGVRLDGHLTVPPDARGVVLFAHGSGSSRHSPRNIAVARVLNRAGIGTLLFDLLNHPEGTDRRNVFDIGLLAGRLHAATTWLRSRPECEGLGFGYFGASTGAAAALVAAAMPNAAVSAVVSRGGRPDLAGSRLRDVRAATLLIVGGLDHTVLELNRQAARLLVCEHRLDVVPGATHLFEEPGTLERAADLATVWFTDHLGQPGSRGSDRRVSEPERTTFGR